MQPPRQQSPGQLRKWRDSLLQSLSSGPICWFCARSASLMQINVWGSFMALMLILRTENHNFRGSGSSRVSSCALKFYKSIMDGAHLFQSSLLTTSVSADVAAWMCCHSLNWAIHRQCFIFFAWGNVWFWFLSIWNFSCRISAYRVAIFSQVDVLKSIRSDRFLFFFHPIQVVNWTWSECSWQCWRRSVGHFGSTSTSAGAVLWW